MSVARVLPAPLRRLLRWLYFRLWLPLRERYLPRMKRPRPLSDIHDFWRNPDDANAPATYATEEGRERSELVVSLIERFGERDASILEVGCNVGRNLEYLRRAGCTKLTGIEINQDATALMRTTYPELAGLATIHNGTVEDIIPTLGDKTFDVVFTVAVLEHIHPRSEWVFAHLPRIADIVISVEDETRTHWRLFHRNYRRVFEGFGMTQIHELRCDDITGLGSDFMARVFTGS